MSELAREFDVATDTTNDGNLNPDNLPEESIDFSLLRLDSFKSSANTTNTPNTTTHYHTPCTACGCSGSSALATTNSSATNKRRSPDPNAPKLDSQDQIPKKPKKLFLESQENITFHDFSKITLPCASSAFGSGSTNPTHINTQTRTTNPIPLLRHCHSDPYNPPVAGSDSLSGSGMGSASNLAPQSPPDNSKMVGATAVTTPASKATASLPPRPRMLRRSVSDPSPNKSFSRSSSSNDMTADGSPHFKWLKRMRDSLKEMNQWWDELMPDEVVGEEDEEDKATEDNTTNAVKAGSEIECEEAVCVERTGDCLVVRFKCPCGKGYQILLSGRDCYYKLM